MKIHEIISEMSDNIQQQTQQPVRKPSKRVQGDFTTTIAGIPCQIVVTHAIKQPGSYSYNAPSDWDYYGYSEFEFDVYDRKGYPAPWLQNKMTSDDEARIEQEYWEQKDDYDPY